MTGISTVHRDIRELQLEEKVILDPKDTATALNDYFVDCVLNLMQSTCPRLDYHPLMPLNINTPFIDLSVVSYAQVDKVMWSQEL